MAMAMNVNKAPNAMIGTHHFFAHTIKIMEIKTYTTMSMEAIAVVQKASNLIPYTDHKPEVDMMRNIDHKETPSRTEGFILFLNTLTICDGAVTEDVAVATKPRIELNTQPPSHNLHAEIHPTIVALFMGVIKQKTDPTIGSVWCNDVKMVFPHIFLFGVLSGT